MYAWLVVNSYMKSEKFNEIYALLIDSAKRKGIVLEKVAGDSLCLGRYEKRPDFVIFWDKDVKLAKMLESCGLLVMNKADAIETCDDKALTYIKLKKSGIKMPKTICAPLCFFERYPNYDFLKGAGEKLGYPMVIKESKGSFGEQVFLAKDFFEAKEIVEKIGHCDFIMQEYIENSKGHDMRVQVVGGSIVTAMERENRDDFRANVTNGGSMKAAKPNKEQEIVALKACAVLALDFAGVDLLFGEDGPILCEVNSNAHFKNIGDCTGVNTADFIIEHAVKKVKAIWSMR